jgi:ribonucleoside-triphosphate reductase (formate)
MKSYLNKSNWEIKENANTNYSLSGLHLYTFEKEIKKFMMDEYYKGSIEKAQKNNLLYIHDLGYMSNYCCGHNLQTILQEGLNGVHGAVSSIPPKHLRSAINQLVNYLFVQQSENAGAQAISNFDTLLSPYIKKDKLSYDEVKQCMQEFIYSINFPTRSGMQSPFTNVTLDLKCPEMFREQRPVISNVRQDFTYGDCNVEIGMIAKSFFEIMMQGDATGRPFTFPIPTVNLHKNFVWDDEVARVIFEATARYGTANFQNFLNTDMNPEDSYSLCCRLRLDKRELVKNTGGVFGSSPNTGSIGVVTINLPRIAYESKGDKELFFKILENTMNLAKESLEIKREMINHYMDEGLYAYMKRYIKSFKTFFSTIGYLGGNEMCLNIIGKDICTKEGQEVMEEVLAFMEGKIKDFQESTGNLYNLEQSPAEGASHKLAKKDKEDYPEIRTAGTSERPYYTNSSHVPVDNSLRLFEMIRIQERFNKHVNGGTACHVFLGQKMSDWINCMLLVKKIAEKSTLPFFDITPTFSVCPVHGYISGEHEECPLEHSDEQLAKYGVDL